jgi:hypothetical protein
MTSVRGCALKVYLSREKSPANWCERKTIAFSEAAPVVRAGKNRERTGKTMKKHAAFAALLALFAGMAATSRSSRAGTLPASDFNRLSTNAAFRDGLYLGRLAARQNTQEHVASGRWATVADRELFIAGYHEGYSVLQAPRPSSEHARSVTLCADCPLQTTQIE